MLLHVFQNNAHHLGQEINMATSERRRGLQVVLKEKLIFLYPCIKTHFETQIAKDISLYAYTMCLTVWYFKFQNKWYFRLLLLIIIVIYLINGILNIKCSFIHESAFC